MKILLFCLYLAVINCSELVHLNVVGKLFTTFRSTLEKAGSDTYLYKLFNSEMSKKTLDKDGNIFLDHDPDTFALLLNLLRGYDVLKGKTIDEMTMLYQDANFFGMTDLMDRIEQLPDEYVNADKYRGGMKRKEKHGYGYESIADGYYEGDFVNGKRHGFGTLSDSKGIYNGQFVDGKKEGQVDIPVSEAPSQDYIPRNYDYGGIWFDEYQAGLDANEPDEPAQNEVDQNEVEPAQNEAVKPGVYNFFKSRLNHLINRNK